MQTVIRGVIQDRMHTTTCSWYSLLMSSLRVLHTGGVSSTLKERDYKQSSTSLIVEEGTPLKVRRLTPLECARLQGLPDYWLDGVEGSDSAKYKMIGNGIAIPCAVDVLGRIVDELEDRYENNQM